MKKLILAVCALVMTQSVFASLELEKAAFRCERASLEFLLDEGYKVKDGESSYRIIDDKTYELYFMFQVSKGNKKYIAHVETDANCQYVNYKFDKK